MSRRRSPSRFVLACSILLASTILGASTALATDSPSTVLDEARRLLADGRAAEAERLLAPHELEMAGQPMFDYLFAVATLDSGHPAAAVPGFERVLARDPDAASARLELGRALFESGDRAAARDQFERLLARDPPAPIRQTAEAYLRAMDEPARTGDWTRELEFGTGYDSNANASTSHPDFFGITLDPDNVATASAFATAAFSLGYVRPVGGSSRSVTIARIGHRWNPDAGFVDQTIATLDTTLDFGDGPTIFSVGVGGHYGLLDGEPHQWGASGDLALTRRYESGWQARGLLRMGMLRYDADFGSLSALDVDRSLVALSLQHSSERLAIGLTAFAGNDEPRQSGSAFENNQLGLQLSASGHDGAGNGLQLQLAYQDVDYDDQPGFFVGLDRSDHLLSLTIAGEIRGWPGPGMNLLPRISWVGNDSNISLYEYKRLEFGLTLQRSF